MPNEYLVGTFLDAETLLTAVEDLRSQEIRIYDVYSPYPVHGLDESMGLRDTRLPWVSLAAGFAGVALALAVQYYASILDWSMNVGGKPDNSILAFIPISFELTVLLSGLSTVAALLLRSRLFPARGERLPHGRVTDDVFALVVRIRDRFQAARAREALLLSGASEIHEGTARL